jgi:hypothetical protein
LNRHVLAMPMEHDSQIVPVSSKVNCASSIPLSASAWGSLNLRISGKLKRATVARFPRWVRCRKSRRWSAAGRGSKLLCLRAACGRALAVSPACHLGHRQRDHCHTTWRNEQGLRRAGQDHPRARTATGGGSCQVRSDAERSSRLLHHARDFGGRRRAGEGAPRPFHPLLKQAAELVPQQQTGVRHPPGPIEQGQASLALPVPFRRCREMAGGRRRHHHQGSQRYCQGQGTLKLVSANPGARASAAISLLNARPGRWMLFG